MTRYADRAHAGRVLAVRLEDIVPARAVVGALPRGGIPVAVPIAERLGATLVAAHARKLPTPGQPELAFGAVDEDGHVMLERATVTAYGLDRAAIEGARRAVLAEIRARRERYGGGTLATLARGRAVVLVDDGLATGLTMRAAVHHARAHGATHVTVAVPCAPPAAVHTLEREADHVICPIIDEGFMAVGQYYDDFSPVPDEEVIRALASFAERLRSPSRATPASAGR